jgi:predicted GH43/DUF377 family glycosyl hydrolase
MHKNVKTINTELMRKITSKYYKSAWKGKNNLKLYLFIAVYFFQSIVSIEAQKIANPLFNGFYAADPSIAKYDGNYYIYATIDPWGGDELSVFVTKDFINWEQKHINWHTKLACTSSTCKESKVLGTFGC